MWQVPALQQLINMTAPAAANQQAQALVNSQIETENMNG